MDLLANYLHLFSGRQARVDKDILETPVDIGRELDSQVAMRGNVLLVEDVETVVG